MIYIYNDYGGTHTTSMAAAFHLNLITPTTEPFTKEQILSIPFFNQLTKKDAGRILFHGKDNEGHPVYTIGRKSSKLVVPALKDLSLLFLNLYHGEERIIFSNTSPTVPFVMTIGGGLSRGLGIDSLGVPLLIKGAQKASSTIHHLVENTKQMAHSHGEEQVLVLDNDQFKI
ncbi:DUF3189 family protein [Halobacillus rhizosphaerae]|uniref:DUF3189 family protein n=1 Tax=Halobacillus rhizosphaerae TaxID=3064889 RepID=UPI00398ABD8E